MTPHETSLRLQCIDHVPFEGAAAVADWARARGYVLARTRIYRGDPFPRPDTFDLLFVLGGPMGVHDVEVYPWLLEEKRFLSATLAAGRGVVGLCLGAQLLAEALGGSVRRNHAKEIGWHPVSLTESGKAHPWLRGWPAGFLPFHWHGDTFSLPPGAVHLAESAGCENQAFSYGERALGLQFHLEYSEESIRDLMGSCPEELRATGPYIQSADELLNQAPRIAAAQALLFSVLDRLAESVRIAGVGA